jgi:hypothetical protein
LKLLDNDNKGSSLTIVKKLRTPLTKDKKGKILNSIDNNKKKEKNHIRSFSFVTSRKKKIKRKKMFLATSFSSSTIRNTQNKIK